MPLRPGIGAPRPPPELIRRAASVLEEGFKPGEVDCISVTLFLKVEMKYCLKVWMWGFCFFSWLMETASGMVSIRPPVGQVAMMLNGLSQILRLCVWKIVWNLRIN